MRTMFGNISCLWLDSTNAEAAGATSVVHQQPLFFMQFSSFPLYTPETYVSLKGGSNNPGILWG